MEAVCPSATLLAAAVGGAWRDITATGAYHEFDVVHAPVPLARTPRRHRLPALSLNYGEGRWL